MPVGVWRRHTEGTARNNTYEEGSDEEESDEGGEVREDEQRREKDGRATRADRPCAFVCVCVCVSVPMSFCVCPCVFVLANLGVSSFLRLLC